MKDKVFEYIFRIGILIVFMLWGMYLGSSTKANAKAALYYTAHTHLIMHQLIDEGCTWFEKDIVK